MNDLCCEDNIQRLFICISAEYDLSPGLQTCHVTTAYTLNKLENCYEGNFTCLIQANIAQTYPEIQYSTHKKKPSLNIMINQNSHYDAPRNNK